MVGVGDFSVCWIVECCVYRNCISQGIIGFDINGGVIVVFGDCIVLVGVVDCDIVIKVVN